MSAVASGTVSPTGSISFYDGLALLGTKSLSSNSASLTLATLGVGSHSITAKYSGDSNFKGSTSNTVIQVVGYKVCLLYDPLKNATKAGSTLPIKLYLCDTNNKNVSSSTLSVMALYVDGSPIPISNSRNTNPNDLFRFVATLTSGGGYIYNLNTTGLSNGKHILTFTVNGDNTIPPYTADFYIQ